VRTVPISSPGDTDPSVPSGSDNTTYLGFVNGDGHPDITVTTDRGQSFSRPVGDNLHTAKVTIARQSGGAGLLAAQ